MAGFFFCSGSNASVASAGIGVTHVLPRLSNSSAPLRTMWAFSATAESVAVDAEARRSHRESSNLEDRRGSGGAIR